VINDLNTAIRGLSREQAIEAASFVASDLGVTAAASQNTTALLDDWTHNPYRHLDEAEELARFLLSVAAADPDYERSVRNALDGVGRKQVVLAGGEIVALAALALGGLHICLSRGKTEEDIKETIETGPDGKVKTVRIRKIKWGISATLGNLLNRVYNPAGK
jgi:hypothetical protein